MAGVRVGEMVLEKGPSSTVLCTVPVNRVNRFPAAVKIYCGFLRTFQIHEYNVLFLYFV